MEDHNSPEAIAQRASQEDPIVMYLIMRESLGMSMGKACAQAGHSTQMMLLKYLDLKKEAFKLHKKINSDLSYRCPDGVWPKLDIEKQDYAHMDSKISIFDEWLASSFRKVALTADDREWTKVKEELPADDLIIVEDAGLTEIPAGSETFIAVWPMRKSQRPRILKRLQALK